MCASQFLVESLCGAAQLILSCFGAVRGGWLSDLAVPATVPVERSPDRSYWGRTDRKQFTPKEQRRFFVHAQEDVGLTSSGMSWPYTRKVPASTGAGFEEERARSMTRLATARRTSPVRSWHRKAQSQRPLPYPAPRCRLIAQDSNTGPGRYLRSRFRPRVLANDDNL